MSDICKNGCDCGEECHGFSEKPNVSDLWQPEFFDILKVLEMGAVKHGRDNWLDPTQGKKASFIEMHDSMFHHLAHSLIAGRNANNRLDKESQLDALLHLGTRALMMYTLIKRGIKHKDD